MKIFITLLLCLVVVQISGAGEQIDFKSLTNDEIQKEFMSASKIDGNFGITEDELKMKFGESDLVSKSQWIDGKQHIYILSDDRRMKVDILNGHIMLAIVENADGSNYLLWK